MRIVGLMWPFDNLFYYLTTCCMEGKTQLFKIEINRFLCLTQEMYDILHRLLTSWLKEQKDYLFDRFARRFLNRKGV